MNAEQFIGEYEQALATQDWTQVESLIHDNCVVTFTTGRHHGKAAVEKAFRVNFESIKSEKYLISDVRWLLETEHFAVFTFNFNWAGIIRGNPASGAGQGTSVIVLHDGRWQLLSEHLSTKAGK